MAKHIFIIETELQTLAALAVLNKEQIVQPVFIVLRAPLYRYLSEQGYDAHYVNKHAKGWLSRIRMLLGLVETVRSKLELGSIVYTARIDLFYMNVLIGTLKKDAVFELRLIPDGALNYIPEDVEEKWMRALQSWDRKIAYGLIGGLKVYSYMGERIGCDADVVTKVYAFEGIESHYDSSKVEYIQFLSAQEGGGSGKRALVVGQPLLTHHEELKGRRDVVDKVSSQISTMLSGMGIKSIYYAAHPRDPEECLSLPEYTKVSHDCLCLEQYIQKHFYDVVVSCSSTVLVNAKLMFGEKVQCYSVGMEILPLNKKQMEQFQSTYRAVGVEVQALYKQ